MTKKTETTDWGKIYYYSFPGGRFALYIYDDDKDVVYLSNVFVDPDKRGNGLGNSIINNAIKKSIRLGASHLCLKCLKTSWVHDWYFRKGFRNLCTDVDEPKYIWMRKNL